MLSKKNGNNLKLLMGYDNRGTLYETEEFIVRQVLPEYIAEVKEIFNLYKELNFRRYGIVDTDFIEPDNVFYHKKHIITYPYEWTANMFKDAVLFHLELLISLDRHGLTTKDALPNNIVYDFYNPIFVDFLSIIRKTRLQNETWLANNADYSDLRLAVFNRMLTPYMLIPLLGMAEKDYDLARSLLSTKACNCGHGRPTWEDLYGVANPLRSKSRGFKSTIKSFAKNIVKSKSYQNLNHRYITELLKIVKNNEKVGFIDSIERLIGIIKNIDVTPSKSAYISYYENKNEAFDIDNQSGWASKQKNVFDVLNKTKPKRVLDIGANTGWFSILANRLGSEVVSIDIDESSIDSLYLYSKRNNLNILPLMISFDDLTKEIYGVSYNNSIYKERDFKRRPFFLSPTERLKSNAVLCLGLIHHLVLGEGRTVENIFEILAELCQDTLIVEYVDKSDKLIQEAPYFFENMNKTTENSYNLEKVVDVGKKHFADVQVLDSNPNTRKLLIFNKRAKIV